MENAENHDIEAILSAHPLFRFSIYTQGQCDTLRRIGEELTSIVDSWTANDGTRTIVNFHRYYDLFFLWILGAYEVVRTMKQHRSTCFSQEAQTRIVDMHDRLKPLRITLAKQELPSTGNPIYGENSVVAIRNGFVFEVGGKDVESGELIAEMMRFISSFSFGDVVAEIPTRRSNLP